jgi:hypothetical protein
MSPTQLAENYASVAKSRRRFQRCADDLGIDLPASTLRPFRTSNDMHAAIRSLRIDMIRVRLALLEEGVEL